MSTTTTPPDRGRRVAALTSLALSGLLAVGVAVLVLPAGEPSSAAGADPTTTATAEPATTTTVDGEAEVAAFLEGLTPEEQVLFRLYTGSDADREAFARWVAPPTTVAPTTTTTTPTPTTTTAPAPSASASGPSNSYLSCVVQRESGGDYGAVNGSSGAGGAYQFLQSTWNNTAANAGRPDLVGIHPSQAAPADQDAMAAHLYAWQGASPWYGPGC